MKRGDVWMANLDPVRGHEQAGRRPVLVVSTDDFNRARATLVIVVPLTSRQRPIPTRVTISPPEGGLRVISDILCDAIRSVAKERLDHHLGTVTAVTMGRVEHRLRLLMGL